jgi:outer membrane protein OmpA-like peptidoglycan-associated protein
VNCEKCDAQQLVAKQIEFINSMSTPFTTKTQHRKFRFVMANHVYADSGVMILKFKLKAGTVVGAAAGSATGATPASAALKPEEYKNGLDDAKAAVIVSTAVEKVLPELATVAPRGDRPTAVSAAGEPHAKISDQTIADHLKHAEGTRPSSAPVDQESTPRTLETASNENNNGNRAQAVTAPGQISDEAIRQHLNQVDSKRPAAPAAAPATEAAPAESAPPALESVQTGERVTPSAPTVIPAPIVRVIEIPSKDPQKADIALDLFDAVLKFKVNEASISKADLPKLVQTAKVLKDASEYLDLVFLIGHTSITGSKTFNQTLSEKRAAAVKYQLVKKGLMSAAQIATSGAGSPKVSSCDPIRECERDRRVELKIRLSQKLKAKNADPVVLKQIRDNIVEALTQIWESNTTVQAPSM